LLRGQEPSSAVRLNSGRKVTNAIIYGNSGHKPLSDGVSGHYSASDSVLLGTNNIRLTTNPFVNLFRIDANSPAFNSGTTEGLRISDTLDLDYNPRLSCCNIDMGAFEFYDLPTTITTTGQPRNIRTVQGAQPVLLAVAAEGTNLEYQWQHNGFDIPGQISNTLPLSGNWSDTGIYQVMIYGVCCNDTSNEVSVKYDPWSLESGGECPEEEGWAKIWVGGPGYSFLWNNGSRDSIITGLQTGPYQVRITDLENRILDLDSFFIKYSPIEITHSIAEPDNIACDNGRIEITVLNSDYVYNFYWEHNGDYFDTLQNLNNAPIGNYKLFIERQDHHFCPSDTFNFSLVSCRYRHKMPTTYMSPNGDGLNDYLDILNIEHYPENTVTVINSYGETIFRAKNYNNVDVVWDGRRHGRLVPDGVYYYLVEVKGIEVMAGWVLMKISTTD
jgi:gliding motility-associated-like protein